MSLESNQISTKPSAAKTPPGHEHVFNDDLLMNDARDRGMTDLEWAGKQFPQIIHVLDHPQFREKFAEHEEKANKARDSMRALGFAAVISATLALLVVATQPVWKRAWPHASWTRWVALLIESGGILAALIAAGGMWLGPWKCRW